MLEATTLPTEPLPNLIKMFGRKEKHGLDFKLSHRQIFVLLSKGKLLNLLTRQIYQISSLNWIIKGPRFFLRTLHAENLEKVILCRQRQVKKSHVLTLLM